MDKDQQPHSDMAPEEPVAVGNSADPVIMPVANAPAPGLGRPKSKKPIKAIIIALGLVLLIGGAAAAYKFWYQDPNKVVSDSFVNLFTENGPITAMGIASIESKEAAVSLDLSVASLNKQAQGKVAAKVEIQEGTFKGESFSLTGEGVYKQDGTVHVKASNLKEVYTKFVDIYVEDLANQYKSMGYAITEEEIAEAREAMLQTAATAIATFDGQWIKFSPSDLGNDANQEYKCLTEVAKRFSNETDMKELGATYQTNQFLVVKKELGSKDGSLGYEVEIDKTKVRDFEKQAKSTAIVKAFNACDKDADAAKKNDDTATKQVNNYESRTFQIWVNRWTHKMTSVNVVGISVDPTSKEKTTTKIDVKFDYTTPVTIEAPQNAKSFKEVLEGIQSLTAPVTGTV